MYRCGKRGFTTIEFIVVVIFIGILAVIAFNTYHRALVEERDAQRITDIETLQSTLSSYFDTFGGYPSVLEEAEFVEEGVLSVLPRDPRTGDSYLYAPLNIGCTSYHLGAVLERGDHGALLVDIDANEGTYGTGCPDGGEAKGDFSGVDPIYDVKP